MTIIYLLRHAETKQDYSKPAGNWLLSPIGLRQAEKIAKKKDSWCLSKIDAIWCSNELKTLQTIQPLAKSLSLPIRREERFDELNSQLMPIKDPVIYLKHKKTLFHQLDTVPKISATTEGIETPQEALYRFQQGINHILNCSSNGDMLVCSHGTILTLYFGFLQEKLTDANYLYDFWKDLSFCALAILENGKIIQTFKKLVD